MISLIPAELRRQLGRKPSVIGSIIFLLLFGGGVLIWAFVSDSATGAKAIKDGTGLVQFGAVLAAIVLGAMAGSYDTDQGTMRYLVLTGRPRWQLALVRVPGLLVTIVVISLPALLCLIAASVVAGGASADGGDYFDLFYMVWMTALLYGLLSLTIGTFLKSNGVAIAVAVVLNFAGALIAGVIYEHVSKTLGRATFPAVADVVVNREQGEGFAVGTSAAILIVWLVVLLGAATLRVQRAEY